VKTIPDISGREEEGLYPVERKENAKLRHPKERDARGSQRGVWQKIRKQEGKPSKVNKKRKREACRFPPGERSPSSTDAEERAYIYKETRFAV